MEDEAKLLSRQIKEVCLDTSKRLAFKPPAELAVFVIRNLVIISMEGIFNKAELQAAKNRQNREKIILARHAVAEIWVTNVSDGLIPLLGSKPRMSFLDYRPECNAAMFVLYYDQLIADDEKPAPQ